MIMMESADVLMACDGDGRKCIHGDDGVGRRDEGQGKACAGGSVKRCHGETMY